MLVSRISTMVIREIVSGYLILNGNQWKKHEIIIMIKTILYNDTKTDKTD